MPKYATQEEIKRKYTHLVRIHHPDVGGDTDLFIKIKEAFATLGDEEKRAQYNKDKREKEKTRIKVALSAFLEWASIRPGKWTSISPIGLDAPTAS